MEKLQKNVDIENSIFKERYLASIQGGGRVPFNKEADAVAKVVHRIVVAKRPKPRYYITKATYLLGYLKRVLSSYSLDKILLRVG